MAAAESKVGAATAEGEIAASFANVRANLPGAGWMQPLRAEALARVMRDGLPHKRLESWKYTDFRGKYAGGLAIAAGVEHSGERLFDKLKCHRVEINGGKAMSVPAAASCQDGLEILNLAEVLAMPSLWLRQWLQPGELVMENLNLAFANGGVLIRVGRGVKVDRPVVLRSFLSEAGTTAHTRAVVALEEGAELRLIEVDDGCVERQCLSTAVTSFVLEHGARLGHLRVSAREGAHLLMRQDFVELERDASFESVIMSSGAAMARQQVHARLAGSGASFDLACAYAAGDGQHTDYTLEVVHEAAHTTSRILAKGVASGNGRGVVQGKVIVRPEAQKSDSHQMSRALLLSPGAEIDQKPELEIFADDVKCGHGATIGSLDANQLFYLQSRGIPEQEARGMLVSAFMGEIAQRLPAGYRDEVEHWLASRMKGLAL